MKGKGTCTKYAEEPLIDAPLPSCSPRDIEEKLGNKPQFNGRLRSRCAGTLERSAGILSNSLCATG
ncbi:hypothetical protein GPL17_35905 [Bradyrhizobium yuanmingense]|nr:hypothetical protein [Bradyrhizobium yuanmingense]MVT55786.1 hypothetical protein [Bradyrhizobium yuanmingense]